MRGKDILLLRQELPVSAPLSSLCLFLLLVLSILAEPAAPQQILPAEPAAPQQILPAKLNAAGGGGRARRARH